MKIIKSINVMKHFSNQLRAKGEKIGFVPTMGYLHKGHLSLMHQARKKCDRLVISIFVNPTQFAPQEDFERYPRDPARDRQLAKEVGVDIIFSPSASQMYGKDYATYVSVERLSNILCGVPRPIHFRGVTTVVMKLFNIIRPHIAYFGQKDFQQAVIIQRMVKDLNMDLKIRVLPIVREKDGLAMSSRNAYLSEEERRESPILYQVLKEARRAVRKGERESKRIISLMRRMILRKKRARIDYLAIVDRLTLEPVGKIKGEVAILLAVWIGKTRLIDNILIKRHPNKERIS